MPHGPVGSRIQGWPCHPLDQGGARAGQCRHDDQDGHDRKPLASGREKALRGIPKGFRERVREGEGKGLHRLPDRESEGAAQPLRGKRLHAGAEHQIRMRWSARLPESALDRDVSLRGHDHREVGRTVHPSGERTANPGGGPGLPVASTDGDALPNRPRHRPTDPPTPRQGGHGPGLPAEEHPAAVRGLHARLLQSHAQHPPHHLTRAGPHPRGTRHEAGNPREVSRTARGDRG